jgi:hypothetical protein
MIAWHEVGDIGTVETVLDMGQERTLSAGDRLEGVERLPDLTTADRRR